MALFDKKPEIAKNSFSVQDAGQVFREAADQVENQNVPAEVVSLLLEIARVVVQIGTVFKS